MRNRTELVTNQLGSDFEENEEGFEGADDSDDWKPDPEVIPTSKKCRHWYLVSLLFFSYRKARRRQEPLRRVPVNVKQRPPKPLQKSQQRKPRKKRVKMMNQKRILQSLMKMLKKMKKKSH